jgi:hypothetical protein
MSIWRNAKTEDLERLKPWIPYYSDRYRFLFELCYTEDEVDARNSVKLIPVLEHLRVLVKAWEEERTYGLSLGGDCRSDVRRLSRVGWLYRVGHCW